MWKCFHADVPGDLENVFSEELENGEFVEGFIRYLGVLVAVHAVC